jgi:predicted ATPase
MLENIEGKVPYESMHLAEISCEATGEFISDTLGLSTKDVEPLTQVVYNKTLGNPLYTRQALEHLVRKNALYYDNVVFSWNWNLGSTRDTSKSATSKCLEDVLADDVLSMVTSKIETIPNKGLQQILAAASFVRASFDSDTLFRVLMSVNDSSQTLQGSSNFFSDTSSFVESREILEQLLGQAVEEGLLLRLSDSQDDNQMYAFAHDQIQEAASNFVSNESEERELFLIKVGVGLLQRAEAIQKDEAWMLFAAARNLNSVPSSHAMFDDAFKIKLVEMNLHTAHLSLSLLAFENAVEYVTKGLSLLTELSSDIWSIHYDFTQNLLNIAAQAELGAGHMDKAEAFCKEVLNQKTHTFSALPSYKVYLDILGGREDHEAALEMNLDVLEELSGIKFPKTDRGIRMKAWVTLQWMKAGGLPTEEKIINMSYASDAVAVATMEFIQKAVRFAFVLKPHLYILLCCESIKWMTKYGLTDTSGASTASFANVVMHKFGDFATGAKLAKLAIFIVDKQKNKFYETQALNTANTNVLGWITPIKTRLPYHVRAYESGVTSGNLEGACVGKWFQFWVLYHSASPLSILEHDLQVMRNKAEKWGYMFFRNFYSLLLQVVLNLSGKSENTTKLIGSSVDETDPMWQKMPHKALLETFRSQLMVFFGDFEKGAEDALVRGNFYSKKMIGMQYGLEPFYRGICLYAMGRKTGDKKFIKAAKEVRKIYQVWVRKGCMNLVGLLKLFDAEELALAVRKEKPACKKYEDSIQTLATGGFYSNAGVASERYATYLAERGFREESRTQLELAKSYYCRWGALKKVEILTNQLASFQ